MFIINEGTSFPLTITYDTTPTAMTYHIYDKENASNIRAETTVTPAASVDILITSADCAITDTSKLFNGRIVIITATFNNDTDDQAVDAFEFAVRNLTSVP